MFPSELTSLNQWVCARKGDKRPFCARQLRSASVNDPETWSTYEQAQWAVDKGYYDAVGFVFNNNGIVGIDIDCGYDEDGILTDTADEIITLMSSYTEISRSGRGFHIIAKGDIPFDGKNNQKGVEIYKDKRYFILTGNVIAPYIIKNQQGINSVLLKHFSTKNTKDVNQNEHVRDRIYNPVWKAPENGHIPLKPHYPDIPKGSRNVCLLSLAGLLLSQGYTKQQIYKELMKANQAACKPPLDNNEIKQIVISIMRYER